MGIRSAKGAVWFKTRDPYKEMCVFFCVKIKVERYRGGIEAGILAFRGGVPPLKAPSEASKRALKGAKRGVWGRFFKKPGPGVLGGKSHP